MYSFISQSTYSNSDLWVARAYPGSSGHNGNQPWTWHPSTAVYSNPYLLDLGQFRHINEPNMYFSQCGRRLTQIWGEEANYTLFFSSILQENDNIHTSYKVSTQNLCTEFLKLNNKQVKRGQRTWKDHLSKDIQLINMYKKILNITYHQGNKNQNYNATHTS